MKILIAVPTYENITPDTFKAIWDLDKGGHECLFEFVRGYDCATARNNIVQKAIDLKVDYVLMVDNDVTPPKEALLWLLEDAPDVQLGYYAHRNADNLYNGRVSICKLGWFNYPLESEFTAAELAEMRKAGAKKIEIHGGGMGCALIKTDLLRRLPYPWYDWVNYKDAHRGMLSEDLYFCELCRKHGIKIYSDVRVGCGHLLRHIQQPV